MNTPRVTKKAIALVILMLHLFLPPFVHAHGLVLTDPHKPLPSHPVCLAVDDSTGHDSSESHHHNTGICHPDAPFVVTRFQPLAVGPATSEASTSYGGRLLPGHPRAVYVPPRETRQTDFMRTSSL